MKKRIYQRKCRRIYRKVIVTGMTAVIAVCSVMIISQIFHGSLQTAETVKAQKNTEKESEKQEKEMVQVKSILQNPELPTGCEATAGTMLLNAYGYDVDKMEVAARMKKGEQVTEGDVVYAPHPNDAFIGNPETKNSYGAFPNVLAEAMQEIIDMRRGEHRAKPLYQKTEKEILEMIDEGIPVCVWASINDLEIDYRRGWYLIEDGEYTDRYFYWPSNEHVLVLTAYDEENVTVCDPMVGECEYSRESFFRHYEQVGGYALIMES